MKRFLRNFCLAVALLFLGNELAFVAQASAITDIPRLQRQDAWGINDACEEVSAASVTLAGNDNTEKILNFYMRKGLNLAQAAGILGNMIQESNLQPNIVQGGRLIADDEEYTLENGVGFGLVQWTFGGPNTPGSRQTNLQQHVDELGVKNTDLGGQLSFTWVELNGDYLSTLNNLRSTNDPVEAAVIVHDGYERSADSPAEVRRVRGGNATEIYDKYKDAPPLAGSSADGQMNNPSGEEEVDEHGRARMVANIEKPQTSASSGCAPQRFTGGNFEETLKAYAWPEYKIIDPITPTDEYAAAVQAAMRQGLYVGGIRNRGIDCGGFVTLLLRDSGYESGYNFDGKGGPTSKQEEWMRANWEPIPSEEIAPGKLQPGDVAINSSHTFIYVGDVDGFGANIASASLDERAPMADTQQSATQSGYNWYRKPVNEVRT